MTFLSSLSFIACARELRLVPSLAASGFHFHQLGELDPQGAILQLQAAILQRKPSPMDGIKWTCLNRQLIHLITLRLRLPCRITTPSNFAGKKRTKADCLDVGGSSIALP
jgi:hypothetical protein